MSRVISSETPGKKRNSILKLLVTLFPVFKDEKISQENRNDVMAFIILSLEEIEKTIIDTITPWEKRDYWTKAERFAAEWRWVSKVNKKLIESETKDGWKEWPQELGDLYAHLASINPARKKLGIFWEGSYRLYLDQKKG